MQLVESNKRNENELNWLLLTRSSPQHHAYCVQAPTLYHPENPRFSYATWMACFLKLTRQDPAADPIVEESRKNLDALIFLRRQLSAFDINKIIDGSIERGSPDYKVAKERVQVYNRRTMKTFWGNWLRRARRASRLSGNWKNIPDAGKLEHFMQFYRKQPERHAVAMFEALAGEVCVEAIFAHQSPVTHNSQIYAEHPFKHLAKAHIACWET